MKELFEGHPDQKDRTLLLNVPAKMEMGNYLDQAKVDRFYQWLHMLTNFAEIYSQKLENPT